ncbi:MAG: HAD hydrolase-like protein [Betaproteobacteria bacterium]|nr:HAD hydrolase-like protein [Betaproteobacteria bacterium]
MAPTKMNGSMKKRLAKVRGFVFDIDGTLALTDRATRGHRALPGASGLLAELRARGTRFAAYTNGTLHTPRHTAASLRGAGLDLRDEELLTPASVAADYFVAKRLRRVLVLGGEGVWGPLREAGIDVVVSPENSEGLDAVLVGWHPRFGFDDLDAACKAVWAGAKLYTVSNAPYFATTEGRSLGVSGAISAAITSVTRKRALVLGKPSTLGLRTAARLLGLKASELAVVGDDPGLEMAMARAGGALAIAVQTGLLDAKTLGALPAKQKPHLVLNGVAELLLHYG